MILRFKGKKKIKVLNVTVIDFGEDKKVTVTR